jgi:hypothetical protein
VFDLQVEIVEKEMNLEGDGLQMGPAAVTHAVPEPAVGE